MKPRRAPPVFPGRVPNRRLGPFRVQVETPHQRSVFTPRRILWKGVEYPITREQGHMIHAAQSNVFPLRDRIYRLSRNGYITTKRYQFVNQFIRDFIFTPRKEKEQVIFRLPTLEEIYSVFPDIKSAELKRILTHQSKKRQRSPKRPKS